MRSLLSSVLLILWGLLAASVNATQITVTPKQDLQQQINLAGTGDELVLTAGTYVGNFVIDKALTLTGSQGVIISANGKGNAITLTHDHITLQHLTITNWGHNLTAQNAGIYANKHANNLVIQHNQLQGAGFGMWLQNLNHIEVAHNRVIGDNRLRSADRGNGIQLSSIKLAKIHDNTISQTRDGLYVISSEQNQLYRNTMFDLRYGIHYMYSYSNKVTDNQAYNTRACYALMSSKHLQVTNNKCRDSEDYGFLLNFINYSTIANNQISNIWTKPEHKVLGRDGKGIFVYNSGYNTIAHNTVNTAEIGIHLTAGSEKVKIFGNNFINNPIQVKYVSNKKQQWSQNHQGNYWSNYLGWDLDHNGIGDVAFEPNDGIDKLAWQYPELKMLMDSPAILILRWVQRQFPILKPAGVTDSFPQMQPITSAFVTEQQELAHD